MIELLERLFESLCRAQGLGLGLGVEDYLGLRVWGFVFRISGVKVQGLGMRELCTPTFSGTLFDYYNKPYRIMLYGFYLRSPILTNNFSLRASCSPKT